MQSGEEVPGGLAGSGSGIVTAMALVTAMAWGQFLAWEPLHAAGAGIAGGGGEEGGKRKSKEKTVKGMVTRGEGTNTNKSIMEFTCNEAKLK